MGAFVRLRLADGRVVELKPGDVLGRMRTAALRFNDPRISEAHALVSLRSSQLRLLALRGRFTIDGRPTSEAVLEVGLVIHLAHDLPLVVTALGLPGHIAALEGPSFARAVLPPVAALHVAQELTLTSGFSTTADALLWEHDERYHLRTGTTEVEVQPGVPFVVAGHELRIVHIDLRDASASRTDVNDVDNPLAISARFDTVHIVMNAREPVVLGGHNARIVSELVALGGHADWEVVAREIWGHDEDLPPLRKRWDSALARLRTKLREGRVRDDLVRTNGSGHAELFLRPGDRVDDQT